MSMIVFLLFLVCFVLFAFIIFPIVCVVDLAKNNQISPGKKTAWIVASIFFFPLSTLIYAALLSPRKGMRITARLTCVGIVLGGVWLYDYSMKITQGMNEKATKMQVMKMTYDTSLPETAPDRLKQELTTLRQSISKHSFWTNSEQVKADEKRLNELFEVMSDSQISEEEFHQLFPDKSK